MDHDKYPIHLPYYFVCHLNIHSHYYNNIDLHHVQYLIQKFPYNKIHLKRRIPLCHEIYYFTTRHDNIHLVTLFVNMFHCIHHVDKFIAEIYKFKVAESFCVLLELRLVMLIFLLPMGFDGWDRIQHCFCITCLYNNFVDPFCYFCVYFFDFVSLE